MDTNSMSNSGTFFRDPSYAMVVYKYQRKSPWYYGVRSNARAGSTSLLALLTLINEVPDDAG